MLISHLFKDVITKSLVGIVEKIGDHQTIQDGSEHREDGFQYLAHIVDMDKEEYNKHRKKDH